MPLCSNCRAVLNPNAKFCNSCGTKAAAASGGSGEYAYISTFKIAQAEFDDLKGNDGFSIFRKFAPESLKIYNTCEQVKKNRGDPVKTLSINKVMDIEFQAYWGDSKDNEWDRGIEWCFKISKI